MTEELNLKRIAGIHYAYKGSMHGSLRNEGDFWIRIRW